MLQAQVAQMAAENIQRRNVCIDKEIINKEMEYMLLYNIYIYIYIRHSDC